MNYRNCVACFKIAKCSYFLTDNFIIFFNLTQLVFIYKCSSVISIIVFIHIKSLQEAWEEFLSALTARLSSRFIWSLLPAEASTSPSFLFSCLIFWVFSVCQFIILYCLHTVHVQRMLYHIELNQTLSVSCYHRIRKRVSKHPSHFTFNIFNDPQICTCTVSYIYSWDLPLNPSSDAHSAPT